MASPTEAGPSESPSASVLPYLIDASAAGDLTQATRLLEAWKHSTQPDPARGVKEPFGPLRPALEAALREDHLHVATYFLAQGFRIKDGEVKASIRAHSTEGLELLLRYGWNINDRWAGYKLPSICSAITRNSLPLVTWFLSHGARATLKVNGYTSATPLSIAASFASLDIVSLLVAHGASPSSPELTGNALHALAETQREPGPPTQEQIAVLDLLVDHGADVNAMRDTSNKIRFAISKKYGALPPLHTAVRCGNGEIVRALLRRGADRNVLDSLGRTAVEVAKAEGREDMVETLEA